MQSKDELEFEIFLGFCNQPDTTPEIALQTLVALAMSGNGLAEVRAHQLLKSRRSDVANAEHFRGEL